MLPSQSAALGYIILFIVIVLNENLPGGQTLQQTVVWTVILSIVAHGLSTLPGIDRYARVIAALDRGAPEFRRAEPDRDQARN